MPASLQVEPTKAKDLDRCDCCGNVTRRVWGFLHRGESTEAAYFVEWIPGSVALHGAHWDFMIGRWDEDATPADRVAVSLAFRRVPNGPEFMVIDSSGRFVARSKLIGRALGRDEVLAGPYAQLAYDLADAVWLQDPRIRELTEDAG